MKKLEIVYKQKTDIVPYVNNTRTHSSEQIAQIKASINEFGMCTPIGLHNGTIVYGHARFDAMSQLGFSEFPTVDLSHLTETQKKAYIIADNQIALNAGWDNELLKVEIEALEEMDFNVDLLGFDDEFFEDSSSDDYSDKNKELDLDDFNDDMEMKFKLNKEQYDFVSERLRSINQNKEIALMEVLSES